MSAEVALDQASGLRRLVGTDAGMRAVGVFGVDPALTALAAANLSAAVAARGVGVNLRDASPEPADVAARLGETPATGLATFSGTTRNTSEVRIWRPDAAEARAAASPGAWDRCAEAALATDWLFAVAPPDGRDGLSLAAPDRILVAPAGKRHLTEAYGLLKSLSQLQPEAHWWILLMGLTDAERGSLMMQAITETARRFLDLAPSYLAGVPRDTKLDQSTRALRAVVHYAPACHAATALRAAADNLARHARPLAAPEARACWTRAGFIMRQLASRPTLQNGNIAHGRHFG